MGRYTQLHCGKDLKSAFFSFLLLCTTVFSIDPASALTDVNDNDFAIAKTDVIAGKSVNTIYDKFDGAGSDYDGSGRNASGNNTLYRFLSAAI
jgi:hypothetical protein